MKIMLNNKQENLEGINKLTVNELLSLKKFSFRMLIIKINNVLIKKDKYDKTVIYNGDNVSVIHLIAGG